jgi:Zn-dependent M32 family carboxypeptidase
MIMSIAPSAEDFESTLKQLLTLSQALLECEENNIEQFQHLLEQREPLLTWLNSADGTLLDKNRQSILQPLIEQIQDADKKVEERFRTIIASQAVELRQLHQGRQVLARYRFPYTNPSSRVENQG